MPLCEGIAVKKLLKASNPPADAPIPTTAGAGVASTTDSERPAMAALPSRLRDAAWRPLDSFEDFAGFWRFRLAIAFAHLPIAERDTGPLKSEDRGTRVSFLNTDRIGC